MLTGQYLEMTLSTISNIVNVSATNGRNSLCLRSIASSFTSHPQLRSA